MRPSKRIRIGGVGVGRGEGLYGTASNDHRADLVAVCDLDIKTHLARGLDKRYSTIEKFYSDFDEFLEHDLDVVMIASPPAFHASQSIAALQADKHVLCEIPVAMTIEESKALIKAVRKSKRIYMSAENVCYSGMAQSWRQLVRDGRIGKPIYAEGEYLHDVRNMFHRQWQNVYFPEAHTSGPDTPTWRASLYPIRYCTHEIGPLLMILDDRVTEIMCADTGSNVAPKTKTIDMAVAIMRTANGTLIKELAGFAVAQPEGLRYFCMYGTKGCMETERWGTHQTLAYFDDVPNLSSMMRLPLTSGPRKPAPSWVAAGGHGGVDGAMVLDFLNAIQTGGPSPIDVYQGLNFTLPGILGTQSAQQKCQWLKVPDPRKW